MAKKKTISKVRNVSIEPDPIFLPIAYQTYKKSKVNILHAQVKILECLHTVENIRILQKQKESLKRELHTNLRELLRISQQVQGLLPILNSNLSKKIEKAIEPPINYNSIQSFSTDSKSILQPDELDEELIEIQAKLNALNTQIG